MDVNCTNLLFYRRMFCVNGKVLVLIKPQLNKMNCPKDESTVYNLSIRTDRHEQTV